MTDITTLQRQLEQLKAARWSGVRETQHKDSRVQYGSDEEFAKAISQLEAEIAQAQGAPRVRNVLLRSPRDRGW